MIISSSPYLYSSSWLPFLKVNVFGLCAAISVLLTTFLLMIDKRREKLFSSDLFLQFMCELVIVGLLSAKLMYALEHWRELSNLGFSFFFSTRGYSLLGSFIGMPVYIYYRLRDLKINFLKFADLLTSKLPVLQAIARMGCHFAGCCVGVVVNPAASWALFYTNPDTIAPLKIPLMPIQLYTSILSLLIFIAIYYAEKRFSRDGSTLALYLVLEGGSRFITDFWRLHRQLLWFKKNSWPVSVSQVLSFMVVVSGCVLAGYLMDLGKRSKPKARKSAR